MANYFKIFLSLLVLAPILFISFSTEITQAKDKKLKYDENSLLALNYHRIRDDNILDEFLYLFSNSKEMTTYSINQEQFEDHIKWLKEHDAKFLTQKEMIKYKKKGHFPKNSVWINFDDMDESIYRNAHPILKKYDVPATGFVITGEVGTKGFHNLNLINKAKLQKMKDSKLWTFQSHTHQLHTLEDEDSLMVKATNTKLTNDIKKSNKYLTEQLGVENHSIAYPYGQTDSKQIKVLKNADIKYGFTLEDRPVIPDDNDYYIPRIVMSDDAFHNLIQEWEGFKDEDK